LKATQPQDLFFWQQSQWEHVLDLQINNQLPQSLLLHGPKGVGKAQFTHYFGSWLLCKRVNKMVTKTPCQECQSCMWMSEHIHPEWFVLAPMEERAVITIDQIRAVQQSIQTTPQYADKKYIVIQQAEKLNEAASHALLKVLEEPNDTSVFIVITDYKNRLKETILSRLTSIAFLNPSESSLQTAYPHLPLWAIRMAQGAPLVACELATPDFIQVRLQFMEQINSITMKKSDPLSIAQSWTKSKENNEDHALYLFYYWLKDLIYKKLSIDSELINTDQIAILNKILDNKKQINVQALFSVVAELEKIFITKAKVPTQNIQLGLENVLMHYAHIVNY